MSDVTVTYRPHPLRMDAQTTHVESGARLSEIVAGLGIADPYARQVVVAINGEVIPEPLRRAVRPKGGTFVTVVPVQGRNELALVAALAVAVAAPYAGAALYGSGFAAAGGATAGLIGTSAIGASLVTAGVTVAGSLLINQLFAPPQPRLNAQQTAPRYDIGGSRNRAALYEPVPLVIGRHRILPPKSATPYTQTNGADVWLHERMTFGYGPIVLESLKIGETPIHLFDDVLIEFRNVDQHATRARYPEIGPIVTAWRAGGQTMTLHPDDIIQDAYNIEMENVTPVTRTSRDNASRIDVEINMPNGVWNLESRGGTGAHQFQFSVAIAPAGSGAFTTAWNEVIRFAQREGVRKVAYIYPLTPGKYDVRVNASVPQPEGGNPFSVFLSSIRTFQAGALPSQPELAEMAVRIRASEQLNGPLDQLSAVVNRPVPTWTGTTWTEPQITSHPAWHIADLLRGPMRKEPVPDVKIDRAGLKAWADQEPQRRCDYVADSRQTVRQLGDLIAAAGRAKLDFNGTYRVVRDEADGPVRQLFTPRNSWGFSARADFPKPIHGLRVQAMSEAAGWQMDEVMVYADGYNEANATIIEPLELMGVAIRKGETTGGEAWRLGRYHIAQHQLRFETATLSVDLEHLVTGIGDKVSLTHDIISVGVGQGRIKSFTTSGENLATITLDDVQDIDVGTYAMTIRRRNGLFVEFTATGGNLSPTWSVVGAVPAAGVSAGAIPLAQAAGARVPAAGVSTGDLVAIWKQRSEWIIKRITAMDDLQATLELVPAAPGVLTADVGVIPPYDAGVSRADRSGRPQAPVVTQLFSGQAAAQRNNGVTPDQARIGIEVRSQASQQVPPTGYRVWWRPKVGGDWQGGAVQAVAGTLYTGTVDRQRRYVVDVQAIAAGGDSPRTRAGTVFAFVDDGAPGVVPDFRANVLGSQAYLTWGRPTRNVDFYTIRHSPDSAATWGESITVASGVRDQAATLPAFNGVFHIRAVNFEGTIGQTSATAVIDSGVLIGTVGTTLTYHPTWAGTADGGASLVGNTVQFTGGGGTVLDDWPVLDDVTALGTFGTTDPNGTYTLDDQIDLGSVQTRRVTADVRAAAAYAGFELANWPVLDDVRSLTGGAENGWELVVEISTTQDTGGSPTWGAWQPLLAGDYTFAQARFRLRCTQDDILLTVTVSQLTIQVGTIA